jgi:sodium-coupled neutral amino acid transporter 11
MARPSSRPPGADAPESHNLLAHHSGHTSPQEEDDSDDGVIIHAGPPTPAAKRPPLPLQISLPPPPALSAHDVAAAAAAESPPHRTPRTPNRVRFDLTPTIVVAPRDDDAVDSEHHHYARESFDMDEEDPLAGRSGGRVPLLTGMEAPSVTVAIDDAEAERSRPKSGLHMAFMNMANSIIGAGIIGQPYAFRQAGLVAGTVLLVVLTVVVDWTICLIVVNSKLSGASSFQGTVERCFGRPGLVAISVAQWVFAFGGMVAFGVIVGDSIPHVLRAVWPGLGEMPVLGLLADRRVVIAVFTMCVSYPLALYRDIAKVSLLGGGGWR